MWRSIRILLGTALLMGLVACRDEADPLKEAQQALARHDGGAALVHLKLALERQPHSALARFLMGQVLLERGEAPAAVIELSKARELGHPPEQVLPPLARALSRQGEHVRVLLLEGEQQQPLPPAAQADLMTSVALAHFKRNDGAAGEAALAEALRLSPGHVPARLLRMQRLAAAGDAAAALALSQETVRSSPDDATAWFAHAQLLAGADEASAEALAAYRKALSLQKTMLAARTGVLGILFSRKDLAAAETELAALRRDHPQDPATAYFETLLALYRGDTATARSGADKLVGAAPTQPLYSRLAATVALETGELSKAAAQLAAAVQANPGDRGLRRLLALTLVRQGDGRQALEVLQPLVGRDSRDGEALALAALASLQAGDRARSQSFFAAAAAHAPQDNARLRATLAMGQLSAGDGTAALRQLEELARADGGSSFDVALISARIQRQEYEQAGRALDALERKQAKDPIVPQLRGDILLRRGERAAARASYESALKLAPHFFPAVAALARLDVQDKRFDQARARFKDLLARDAGNTAALLALARLDQMTDAPPQDTARLLAEAVRTQPLQAAPRLRLIEHELHHGHWRAALTAADEAVQAMPADTRLQAALARACIAGREYNRAVQVLGKLVAAQPRSAEPLRQLARALMAQQRVQQARHALQQAAALESGMPGALADLVRLEISDGRLDEARRVARRVQAAQPKQALGHLLEGEAAAAAKAWAEAEAAYRAAQARSRDSAQAAIGLHAVLVSAGKREQAAELSARWLKEHPKDADFTKYLGDRALLARDFAAAQKHYDASLRGRPDNATVLNNLAWVAHQLKRDDALPLAERAVRLRPAEPAFVDTLARLLAAAGRWEPALRHEARAVELAPHVPDYHLTLARMYLQAGQKAKARVELDRLDGLGIGGEDQAQVAALRKLL